MDNTDFKVYSESTEIIPWEQQNEHLLPTQQQQQQRHQIKSSDIIQMPGYYADSQNFEDFPLEEDRKAAN
uniref:Uncharacterized protein n=1 Tax=Panagrolaimus sp. PS1159 TaxID=55785 RepID=A0AC35GTV8_9BILA